MRKLRCGHIVILTGIFLNALILMLIWQRCGTPTYESVSLVRDEKLLVVDHKSQKEYRYNNDIPIIFIGGVPRSGTTLMRAMLDSHHEVRCGEETRVVPRILGLRSQWLNSPKEAKRLLEAGLSQDVLDQAISSFILEIIVRHGPPAPRLCNKDPFTMKSAEYLSGVFPQSKFILMIRDGRATVHSIISRKVTITGFDLTNYRACLQKWNQAITAMYHQCFAVGETRCFPMYYEQLVLHPEPQMRALLKFLDLPWNESVLHHDEFIGNKISLSKTERSTDQVVKPINLEALSKWVGQIPADVVKDMATIAPMLSQLGYDPHANPPDYGKADKFVLDNTNFVQNNEELWKEKIFNILNTTDPRKLGPGTVPVVDGVTRRAHL